MIALGPRARALEASYRLGDKSAKRELDEMNDNTTFAWVATVISTAVVLVAVSAIQACRSHESEKVRHGAELRLQYVRSCRMTPDEAERVVPGADSALTSRPVVEAQEPAK